MPKVSIIVPCYNAERRLEETLFAALSQTMGDFEIVCVDNNSTDSTPDILAVFEAADERVKVVSEPEQGEGPARDAGLAHAQGEWLYFLDSDDIMRPDLLRKALGAGTACNADVVVFRVEDLDDQTGEVRPADYAFQTDWLELEPGTRTFDPHEHPGRIFNSFHNWVHNKLFNAAFIRERGITVQHVHRTADLLFTCRALSEAQTIALLDEPLHLYRMNNPASALATSDSHPLDFYEAFKALRVSLEEHGTWDLYRDSFVNWAMDGVAYNLAIARTFDAFTEIASAMKTEGLAALDIADYPEQRAYKRLDWENCQAIRNLSIGELAFRTLSFEREIKAAVATEASGSRLEIDRLRKDVERLRQRIVDIESSKSYRLGNAVAKPARTVREIIRRET